MSKMFMSHVSTKLKYGNVTEIYPEGVLDLPLLTQYGPKPLLSIML